MINKLKKILYFPGAYYFRFFAKIQLAIWKPRIIVVTGSSGKTTLLHLIESQLQNRARYSHQANSSYGIPFDILGLQRKDLTPEEWIYLFFAAPFKAFKKPPKEKLYIVEADCDRPFEGKFLANLLKPEVTLWTNVSRTHTMNFDSLTLNRHSGKSVSRRTHPESLRVMGDSGQARMTVTRFVSVEQAIAHEFGYFLQYTTDLAILNSDNELIKKESRRSKATIKYVSQKGLTNYRVLKDHTEFRINGKHYSIKALLPKETSYSIQMTLTLLTFLKIKPDPSFSKFKLPPGRASVFKGIKNTTIIDSSYNATPDGVKSILGMFDEYPSDKKWLVLGDMIELGNEEEEEHEKLADIISSMKLNKIILVGPRLSKYTYPRLKKHFPTPLATPRRWQAESHDSSEVNNKKTQTFLMPKEALDYLLTHLRGGEAVLFKGARFLEGVIEHLLIDKKDINKLCRRELVWQERRKKWGL